MHSSGGETWTDVGGYASSQQVAGMAQRAVLVVRGCWKSSNLLAVLPAQAEAPK